MACEACEFFQDKDRCPETFRFWNAEFDIDKAKELAKGKQVFEAETVLFKDIVAYPPIPGKIYVMRISVDEGHIDHVDLSLPIILVPKPKRFGDGEMVIDGHHRIARAMRDNVKNLKCVMLTREEMNGILFPKDLRDNSRQTKAVLRKRAEKERMERKG